MTEFEQYMTAIQTNVNHKKLNCWEKSKIATVKKILLGPFKVFSILKNVKKKQTNTYVEEYKKGLLSLNSNITGLLLRAQKTLNYYL